MRRLHKIAVETTEIWFESHCPGNGIFSVTLLVVLALLVMGRFNDAAFAVGLYSASLVSSLLLSFVVSRRR